MQTRLKDRKEQIVSTALSLLQTHGYENFSYLDIAKQLGITKASIHHHFPKKSDLGVALCDAIQLWHESAFTKILAMPCSAPLKLEHYINGMLKFACGDNKICPLSSLQADITLLPQEMRVALKALDEHELVFISKVLEEGIKQGDMSFEGCAQHQAIIVVLTCKGALQYSRLHGEHFYQQSIKQLNNLLSTTVKID